MSSASMDSKVDGGAMSSAETGVLLIDWDNLAGAVIGRRKMVTRSIVDGLRDFADRACGGQLRHADMAAVRFDGTIEAAMNQRLINQKRVGTTKEQADILLTVLAMDYLYEGVQKFILVTGDQDFIPLISKLNGAGRDVTVVYGDLGRLSAGLRKVLETTPGLKSMDIEEIVTLVGPQDDPGCQHLLGMLELQRRGHILGGQERGDRTALLAGWGVIQNQDHSEFWALIEKMAVKVTRNGAAVKDGERWVARNAIRTYLRFDDKQLSDITAIDFAVRRLSAEARGVTVGGLRSGPFQTDSGVLLGWVLDALSAVELVRKGADGAYSMIGQGMPLGYLEQLWRVHAGLAAECYKRKVTSIPYGHLAPLLGRKGVGQGPDQRAAGRIREAISYARNSGVIDVIAVDGQRHALVTDSPLCRQFVQAYRELYREFRQYVDEEIPEAKVIYFMDDRDSSRPVPRYGFDNRDRHRVLRVLAQSLLLSRHNDKVTWQRSRWGDTLIGNADGG